MPAGDRLSDEEWRTILDAGNAPSRTEPLVLDPAIDRVREAWQSVMFPPQP